MNYLMNSEEFSKRLAESNTVLMRPSPDDGAIKWDWSGYRCKTTGLTCCGCSLFCEHREEKRNV